jgi:exonuclease VII small subunit
MENFEKIKQILESAESDAIKFFEKGNKQAGTRLRKAYGEIANLCKEGRKEVSAVKNAE